jgi:hypothetical protein
MSFGLWLLAIPEMLKELGLGLKDLPLRLPITRVNMANKSEILTGTLVIYKKECRKKYIERIRKERKNKWRATPRS